MTKTKPAASGKEKTAKEAATTEEVKVCRRTQGADRRGKGAKKAEATGSHSTKKNSEQAEADRASDDREAGAEETQTAQPERRKVQRRRQIDPTTCERDYTQDEIEFMHALDAYKRANGRMFPTCSEILEVVRSLGYERVEGPAEEAQATEVTEAEEGDSRSTQHPASSPAGFPKLADNTSNWPATEHEST